MPADYTSWDAITGTDQAGATALDWISFNFTSASQAALQQPYQLGASATAQNSDIQNPIMYIDNTGNTDEKFTIYYTGTLTSGISIFYNSTCTGACAGTEVPSIINMTAISAPLTTALKNDEFLNVSLFANTSLAVVAGTTSIVVYVNASAV